jgi:hypothetical protein
MRINNSITNALNNVTDQKISARNNQQTGAQPGQPAASYAAAEQLSINSWQAMLLANKLNSSLGPVAKKGTELNLSETSPTSTPASSPTTSSEPFNPETDGPAWDKIFNNHGGT